MDFIFNFPERTSLLIFELLSGKSAVESARFLYNLIYLLLIFSSQSSLLRRFSPRVMKFSISEMPHQRVSHPNQHMPLLWEVGQAHWSLGNHQILLPWSIHLHPCLWRMKWVQLVLCAVVFALKDYYLFLAMLSELLLAASDLWHIEWPIFKYSISAFPLLPHAAIQQTSSHWSLVLFNGFFSRPWLSN